MKKLYLALYLVITIVAMTACGQTQETKKIFEEAEIISYCEEFYQSLSEQDMSSVLTQKGFQQFEESYSTDFATGLKNYVNMKADLGDFVEFAPTEVHYSEDTAVATLTVKHTKQMLSMSVTINKEGALTGISAEIHKTLGQKVVKALLNTVMGMSVVFAVLILISFIISLLKYVPGLLDRKNKQQNLVVEKDSTIPLESYEEEELVDDTELVAVITAAIMASMGEEAPADGLVVRSIRRVNKKWKNA